MSDRYRIEIRTTPSFKRRLRELLSDMYELGLSEDKNLSAYTEQALIEKRDRDLARVSERQEELRANRSVTVTIRSVR